MKELNLKQMETVEGGGICTASWAVGGVILGAVFGTITFGAGVAAGLAVAAMGEVACMNTTR